MAWSTWYTLSCFQLLNILLPIQVTSKLTSLYSGYGCPDVDRVCASMLRVGSHNGVGGTVIDEGPYCSCETCPKAWDEAGDQTLTWYHHEKSDWLVQYKFCEPIIPKRTCAEKDVLAAVIEADAEGWNPRLKSMACRCPKGFYHLQGWVLERHQHWDYHYTCERPLCTESKACVKHYLDRTLASTAGYRFLCTCPEGHVCPTSRVEGQVQQADGADEEGPYLNGYCKKIQSHLKKEYVDKLANKIHKS